LEAHASRYHVLTISGGAEKIRPAKGNFDAGVIRKRGPEGENSVDPGLDRA